MHAKHVLLLIKDGARSTPESEAGADALVLVTTSANLTLAGWCTNAEIADIEVMEPGQVTSLKPGLSALINQAVGWLDAAGYEPSDRPLGFVQVSEFIEKLEAPEEPGFPRLWIGEEPLSTAVQDAARDLGIEKVSTLTVGAPYFSEDAGPVRTLIDNHEPQAVRVMRPVDMHGIPMSTGVWERTLHDCHPSLTIHALQNIYTERQEGQSKAKNPGTRDGAGIHRTTHLKWVQLENKTKGLIVLGSPNLSGPAFDANESPGSNFETAILRAYDHTLSLLDEKPLDPLPEDVEESNLCDDPNAPGRPQPAPYYLVYDWKSHTAKAVPVLKDCALSTVSSWLRAVGDSDGWRFSFGKDGVLDSDTSRQLRKLLKHGPYVGVLEDGRSEPYTVHVIEQHQEFAPPRQRFPLSLDLFLQFLGDSGYDAWERAAAAADRDERLQIEAEEQVAHTSSRRPDVTLDRPIRIIQAVGQLERRLQAAIDQNDRTAAERILLSKSAVSVYQLACVFAPHDPSAREDSDDGTLFERVHAEEDDLVVDQLVCWLAVGDLCARYRDDPFLSGIDWKDMDRVRRRLECVWNTLGDLDPEARELGVNQLKDWLSSQWTASNSTAVEGASS
jgi:hypothetical protein